MYEELIERQHDMAESVLQELPRGSRPSLLAFLDAMAKLGYKLSEHSSMAPNSARMAANRLRDSRKDYA